MRETEPSAGPVFRGSISRRLTVLSVLFFVPVIIVGGVSVHKARHIEAFHDESEELDAHSRILDRLKTAIFHPRAEAQDALLSGRN